MKSALVLLLKINMPIYCCNVIGFFYKIVSDHKLKIRIWPQAEISVTRDFLSAHVLGDCGRLTGDWSGMTRYSVIHCTVSVIRGYFKYNCCLWIVEWLIIYRSTKQMTHLWLESRSMKIHSKIRRVAWYFKFTFFNFYGELCFLIYADNNMSTLL